MDTIRRALKNSEFERAKELATEALKSAPQSAPLLLALSTANLRLGDTAKALEEAEAAVLLADSSTQSAAQLRRAIALYQLKRYAEAETVIEYAAKNIPQDWPNTKPNLSRSRRQEELERQWSETLLWRTKINTTAKGLEHVEVVEIPPRKTENQPASTGSTVAKPRYDWYQDALYVTLTIFARDTPENAEIKIGSQQVSIEYPGFSYELQLSGAVDPSKSRYEVTKFKVEFKLARETAGQWRSLTSAQNDATASATETAPAIATSTIPQTVSSVSKLHDEPKTKPAPFNTSKWDDLEVSDDESTEDPNAFFRTIYKNADPDTQRAMMKSYTESNGTSLSTNWEEVSKGRVEPQPPSDMKLVDRK